MSFFFIILKCAQALFYRDPFAMDQPNRLEFLDFFVYYFFLYWLFLVLIFIGSSGFLIFLNNLCFGYSRDIFWHMCVYISTKDLK